MTRALAASTVIAIFATFFAMYGALGTNSNRGEIGSLHWEVSSNRDEITSLQWDVSGNSDEIESLRWEIEDIKSTLGR
jgi:hypothetical protein